MQQAKNPHLAIEGLRRLVEQEMRKVTKHNIVRQQSFSDRLLTLMRKYTNQHLTAARVIAELVAMAEEFSADADRGAQFNPALTTAELAFYDAVAENESALPDGRGQARRDRPGPGRVHEAQCEYRLGVARRRTGEASLEHQTSAGQTRLSSGHGAGGD